MHYDPPDGYATIFSDDHLILADKPPGLLSVPGRGPEKADCLISRLQADYGEILGVHRLDMSTSGLMVFARDKPTQSALARQFQEREVRKQYLAIVAGKLAHAEGEIDLPLRCDWPNRPRQMVCDQWGKPSQTHYEFLADEAGNSRVLLQPLTGRSHQLRVHMASIGHSILGDELYGDQNSAPRLFLHASMLSFRCPHRDTMLRFDSVADF